MSSTHTIESEQALAHGLGRRWWVTLGVVGIVFFSRLACHFLAHDQFQKSVTDLLSIAMSGLMAISLLWTSVAVRAPGTRFSPGWLLLGLSMLMWMIADILWFRSNLMGGNPSGSTAHFFFLAFYPLFLAGVLFLPRHRRTRMEWIQLSLDMAVATCAGLVVLWVVIVGPTLQSQIGKEPQTAIQMFIALAYPTGDLLVLWAAIALIASGRIYGMITATRLLAGAGALLVFADTVYGYQLLKNTYHSGNWLGVIWSASLGLIGIAGATARPILTLQQQDTVVFRHPALGSLLLSSVCFIIAWVVVSWSPVAPRLQIVEVGVLVMIVLTVVRQGLGMIENHRLTARLRLINEDLDERVRERTADLEMVNEHLRQAQKMEAIGRLAGGIAHDFNNLLTVIIGNADLLRRQHVQNSVAKAHLDSISLTVGRAADLIRQLLAFSRRTPLIPQATVLPDIVDEVDAMLKRVLPPEIRLLINHQGEPPVVYADASQLVQVVMNLAINARDALTKGGTLTISTSMVTLDAQAIERIPGARIGNFAVLAVRDTGIGMDEDTRRRMFEPFFTTKPPGAGTGLGLATVHGIVNQSGGWISVESAIGQGSTFNIYLDLHQDTPSGITRVVPTLAGENITGTRILLVDDEPAVQLVAYHTLKALGCVVHKTANAGEALAVFEQHRAAIDLVITDGIMPGMRGQELIRVLRKIVPNLPIILCSGYAGEKTSDIPRDVTFLAKPFTADTLAQAVRRAIPARR